MGRLRDYCDKERGEIERSPMYNLGVARALGSVQTVRREKHV